MNALLTFDADVNALYVQFSEHDVADTVQLAKGVLLDVDADGEAVGLEVLNADSGLADTLATLPDTVQLAAFLRRRAA